MNRFRLSHGLDRHTQTPVDPPRYPLAHLGALPVPGRPTLGPREQQALLSWLLSDSKKVAAQQMCVTESTLHTHITRVRDKYAAVGRPAPTKSAMLARAIQDGLIQIHDL